MGEVGGRGTLFFFLFFASAASTQGRSYRDIFLLCFFAFGWWWVANRARKSTTVLTYA